MAENRKWKSMVLKEILQHVEILQDKIRLVDSLDRDRERTDAYDLHDQISSMESYLEGFEASVVRASAVNGD